MSASHGFTRGQRGGGGLYLEPAPAGWQSPAPATRPPLSPESAVQIAVVAGLAGTRYAVLAPGTPITTWSQVYREAYQVLETPHPAVPVTAQYRRLPDDTLVKVLLSV